MYRNENEFLGRRRNERTIISSDFGVEFYDFIVKCEFGGGHLVGWLNSIAGMLHYLQF